MKKKLFVCEIKENIFQFFNMVLMTSLTMEIVFLFIAIVSQNAQLIFSDEYLKTYEIISLNNTDELEHAVEIIGADNIEEINIDDKNEIVVGSLVVQTKKKLSSTQRKQLEKFDDDLTNVQLYNKYNIREKLIVVALYAAMFSVIIGLCVRNMVGIYKIYEHSNAEKYSIYINNGADAGFITRLKAFYFLFSFLCSAVIIVLINVILRLV